MTSGRAIPQRRFYPVLNSALGSPLTDAALPKATTKAVTTINRVCSRINQLDAHTGVFFLAHDTAAPRLTYRGPQLLWYTLRSDLFSVHRAYFSEFLNETITIKSASTGASF